MSKPTIADTLLESAYSVLGLSAATPAAKYGAIPLIISHLAGVHAVSPISQGTTGAISERLCIHGLEMICNANAGFKYRRFSKDWKWVGDILLSGDPYDLTVSVKSYKAKERLIASGTGSLLAPTIGWGLFNDKNEWSKNRTASYLYRGFIAIYMPGTLLSGIGADSKAITNINGKLLLRDLVDFPGDMMSAVSTKSGRIDFRKI